MITTDQIKELRNRTHAGLSACKSALTESDGDMDAAIEILLKKGLSDSVKRAGKVATEGVVATNVNEQSAVIVEVNIQTDFAARNKDFLVFVDKVVQAAELSYSDDLGSIVLPRESSSIEEMRTGLVSKLGENINIRRWKKLVNNNGKIVNYTHLGNKIGVLVSADCDPKNEIVTSFLDNVAMQIAAMNPLYLSESSISELDKEKQIEIFKAQLAEEGKIPESKWDKVIVGKLSKWFSEVCLLNQQSVWESKKTISSLLDELEKSGNSVSIVDFVRFECGEGIAKQKENFADEVAATLLS